MPGTKKKQTNAMTFPNHITNNDSACVRACVRARACETKTLPKETRPAKKEMHELIFNLSCLFGGLVPFEHT